MEKFDPRKDEDGNRDYITYQEDLLLCSAFHIDYINLPTCGLCGKTYMTIKKDAHGINMLWCEICGIYFYLYWKLVVNNHGIPKIAIYSQHKDYTTKDESNMPFQSTPEQPPKKHPITVQQQIYNILKQENKVVETSEFIQKIGKDASIIVRNLTKMVDKEIIIRVKRGKYVLPKIRR